MAEVREAETYHTASVLHDAIFEAERLCTAIYHAVTDAYFTRRPQEPGPDTGLTAAETAESPPMQAKVREALNCL